MNGILGVTELMRDTRLDDEQQEYLDLIRGSADALLRVINDILDFSKIEAGRLDLANEEFRLRPVLSDAVNLLAVRAQKKGLELAFRVAPDVPEHLIGDPIRLRQILVNLVGNAVKFTDEGDVIIEVTSEPVTGQQVFLHCAVSDTGIGIPDEKRQLIFHAFRQADSSATRRFGGTGLGLAISSQLAQRMHGRMWVESEAGAGSTFHFTALLDLPPRRRPPPELTRPAEMRGRRVLVIDDHDATRAILMEMLGGWDISGTGAASAADARAALDSAQAAGEAFDVILCDSSLADDDGFEVARELRERAGGAPSRPLERAVIIMMIAALDRPTEAQRTQTLGFAGQITRPIDIAELFAALMRGLGHSDPFQRESTAADRRPPQEGFHLNVLLAEDNTVNQRVAVRMLERLGHRVHVVGDGRDAVEALEESDFDLVLMDVQMQEMGGFEATRLIRQRRNQVPIVAMTAHAARGDRARCEEAGMNGYIAKPITGEALRAEIARLFPNAQGAASFSSDGSVEPADPSPLFDRTAALQRLENDEDLLRELIELFLDDYAERRAEMDRSLESDDRTSLKQHAHALRGALSNFFARPACEAAEALENALAGGDWSSVQGALRALESEVDRLIPVLRAEGSGMRT